MVEQRLVMEQSQKLIITQELRQAITLLTMPLQELQQFIESQLEENPVLEVVNPEKVDDIGLDVSEINTIKHNELDKVEETVSENSPYNWDEIADEWNDRVPEKAVFRENEANTLEPIANNHSSLADYLGLQLHILNLSSQMRAMGEFIINNINDEGYLTMARDEICQVLNCGIHDVEEVIHIVQGFDPPGIAGYDLKSCLTLQLDKDDDRYDILYDLINNELNSIASNKLPILAKKYKISLDELKDIVDQIKQLNPKPGMSFSSSNVINYIYPDVVIEKVDDDFVILVNDSSVPKLGINSYYMKIMKDDKSIDHTVKDYMHEKLNSAAWIIKGIEQRRATIYNVADAIIHLQREFFDQGVDHVAPLNLVTVADYIGMHESTVSRAISNKYVQTPHGLFSWKFFFVNGVGGNDVSNSVNNIKKIMKEIIDNENMSKPHSDSKIMELLIQRDIHISRRTVAKYREDLGILSACKRKQY